MLFLFWLPIFTGSPVDSTKLSTEENERVWKICGAHYLENQNRQNRLSFPTYRSVGGRALGEDEYPWTVTILKNQMMSCSGVQISPRHILTAGHCVMDTVNPENCENDTSSVVSIMISPQQLSVYVGRGAAKIEDPYCCDGNIRGTVYKATKITTHDYEYCEKKDDIALIEVSADIPDHISVPICMPSEGLPLKQVLYATGSGSDPTIPKTFTTQCIDCLPDVVAQQFIIVDESMHKIFATAYAKSTCQGDSGGPVFQTYETDRNILVGLTSHGDLCLKSNRQNIKSYIVDVRAYLDWICKHSGVCAIKE